MGNKKHCSIKIFQSILKYLNRINIQMLSWLVQNQQGRFRQKQFCKRNMCSFPPLKSYNNKFSYSPVSSSSVYNHEEISANLLISFFHFIFVRCSHKHINFLNLVPNFSFFLKNSHHFLINRIFFI